ncbi:DHHC zinc finger membrane protein [Thermoascus aurantiacus ATCC 26904]
MATLASPSPPSSPTPLKRRTRAIARRIERYCCAAATYFPLAFVYGLTTWAVWVETKVGFLPTKSKWIGAPSTALGILLYTLLNLCYTVAVFTDPGSPLSPRTRRNGRHEYSHLPTTEVPEYTSFTVSSTGGARYCKKCQCPKPDRTHHCSSCKRCVLKMDHHCPWLATCVGFRNYKAFVLFLIYTSLFCWVDFAVGAYWVWTEILNDSRYVDSWMPVNVVLLAILAGIIGLVLTGFTAWHISLAVRGMTTIECLEKTRYAPLRKSLERQRWSTNTASTAGQTDDSSFSQRLQDYGQRFLDAHMNAIPGVTRPEEGEERPSPTMPSHDFHRPDSSSRDEEGEITSRTPAQQALARSYAQLERQRERERYNEYLDERDNEKLPNAFDLGWRKNLLHLFGEQPLFWPLPVCNTTGDGWNWEPSPKFLEARERLRQKREQERAEEQEYYRELYERHLSSNRSSGYGMSAQRAWSQGSRKMGNPNDDSRPSTGVSMKTLRPMSPRPRPGDSDYEDNANSNSSPTSNETTSSSSSDDPDTTKQKRRLKLSPREAGRPPPRSPRNSILFRQNQNNASGQPPAGSGNDRGGSDEWRDWD